MNSRTRDQEAAPATVNANPFFVRDCDLHEFSFGYTVEFVIDGEEAEC